MPFIFPSIFHSSPSIYIYEFADLSGIRQKWLQVTFAIQTLEKLGIQVKTSRRAAPRLANSLIFQHIPTYSIDFSTYWKYNHLGSFSETIVKYVVSQRCCPMGRTGPNKWLGPNRAQQMTGPHRAQHMNGPYWAQQCLGPIGPNKWMGPIRRQIKWHIFRP